VLSYRPSTPDLTNYSPPTYIRYTPTSPINPEDQGTSYWHHNPENLWAQAVPRRYEL